MSLTGDIFPKHLYTKLINSSKVIKEKMLFNKAKDKVFLNLKKVLAHAKKYF